MHFCPFCTNLLIPEQHQSMVLSCTTCPYVYKLNATHVVGTVGLSKRLETEAVQTGGSKCTVKCPVCPSEEAWFREIQTRSADEPMTIFYQCVSCSHNWKD